MAEPWGAVLRMGNSLFRFRIDSCLRLMGGRWGLICCGISKLWQANIDAVVKRETIRATSELNQSHGDAVSWLWEPSIQDSTDRRLINPHVLRQPALAEALGHQ